MSHRFSPFVAVLLFSITGLHAEEPVPPAKTTEPLPPYELKKRSAFAVTGEKVRAPFWPIGWVKRKAGVAAQAQAPASEPRVLLDEKSFKVTSILLGAGATPSLAVINGRAYSEGEFLRLPKGGTTPPPRIRVQRINDGTVVLQNADQTIVASLQRPELLNKKPEELLIDPDR